MHFLKIKVTDSADAVHAARSAFNAGLVSVLPYDTAPGGLVLSGYADSSAPVGAARATGATVTLLEDTGGVELPQTPAAVARSARVEMEELKVPEALAGGSEEAGQEPTFAFAVRITGAHTERSALVDAGTLVTQALAGLVTFAKPPTAWVEDAWTVSGHGAKATVKAVVRGVALPHGVKAHVAFV